MGVCLGLLNVNSLIEKRSKFWTVFNGHTSKATFGEVTPVVTAQKFQGHIGGHTSEINGYFRGHRNNLLVTLSK